MGISRIIPPSVVPAADATSNVIESHVVGNKTDAAVVAVGTTKSIIAYVKGIITMLTKPAADATGNTYVAEVIGDKTDAAVTTVGTTKSLMAYLKGILNAMARGSTTTETANGGFSSGTNGSFSSWNQMIASTANQATFVAVGGGLDNQSASENAIIVQIGFGGAGAEVICGQWATRVNNTTLGPAGTWGPIVLDRQFAAGTRLAIRASASQASNSSVDWGMTVSEV